MKKMIDNVHINNYASKAFDLYFQDKSFAVFDIETTGLSPSSCKLILSGILLAQGNQCQIIQFFADQPDDEEEIIVETLRILSSVDYLITYNGKHFDLPFLAKRAEKYGITFNAKMYNLDLYLVVNGHSALKEVLPNLKQKSVEVFMGIADSRCDQISGSESVKLYQRYMETRSFDLEKKILLHNHDDLIQLYKLLPIISKVDFHKAMFKLGFPVGSKQITKISLSGDDLNVVGIQTAKPVDYISFPTEECPYSITMNKSTKEFKLTILGQAEAGAMFIDTQTLLTDTENIKRYPSFTNGYLILQQQDKINYLEINAFLLAFLNLIDQL